MLCANGHSTIAGTKQCTTNGCEFYMDETAAPVKPIQAHHAPARVLTVCEQGINRSVTLASLLKFRGHDTISVGLDNNSAETLALLFDWAEVIALTAHSQEARIPAEYRAKVELFSVGPDIYPRPFNPELYRLLKQLLSESARV